MCARPGVPSSGIERPAEKHILALDGIRGLAILLVLYHHLFWSNPNSGNPFFDFLNAIRASAFIGVNLFFALSGFLITGILLDTVTSPNFFKNFYARRMLRIFPPTSRAEGAAKGVICASSGGAVATDEPAFFM